MKLTKRQEKIVQSLLDIKPINKGRYIVLTKNELYRMNMEEFIQLCKEIVPKEKDLIAGFCIESGRDPKSYLCTAIRKSLISCINRSYTTMEIELMKKQYPSYFKHDR